MSACVSQIEAKPGVSEVFVLPMSMKVSPELLLLSQPSETSHGSLPRAEMPASSKQESSITLKISAGAMFSSAEALDALAKQWRTELDVRFRDEVSITHLGAGSTRKMSMTLSAGGLNAVLLWLVRQPETMWVEERGAVELHNKYAANAVRGPGLQLPPDDGASSSNTSSMDLKALWARGLRGEGEIVGVADTGVDTDSCFFYDPVHPLPVCTESLQTTLCRRTQDGLTRSPTVPCYRLPGTEISVW